VQRIPGRGQKIEPVANDRLVAGTWPRFLHPYPLNDKYFLAACKTDEPTPWAIYLADVFDNLLLLRAEEGFDLTEPLPVQRRSRPPIIRHQVDPKAKDAVVTIADVYAGPGLAGVPRGAVKKLRLMTYHYAYQNMAEDSQAIGVNSSWDTVKIVLGTVPVHPDGSASFRVPANTPISLQPLDARGRALQLMRSWLVAMPGEHLSCIGCHESRGTTPPPGRKLALARRPADLEPWLGPPRGFSFVREVQPVLDKYCVGCHNGTPAAKGIVDLTARKGTDARGFSPAYSELHRYVRRPGAETDYHLLPPGEFHAETSELVQMLEKGHYGVELDDEAWNRLATWIDLNVPFHGTWHEAQGAERVGAQREKRRQARAKYAGLDEDPEAIPVGLSQPLTPVLPKPVPKSVTNVSVAGWPFDAAEARRRQDAAGATATRSIDLGAGVALRLTLIPKGKFVMGDAAGAADESPTAGAIDQPFWIGVCEVTNEQFARFDPTHDSRYIQTPGISSTRGYPVNEPKQPAVRVSWLEAIQFCRWLSKKTGEEFTLPTEAQWEYACRAGTATPFWFGDGSVDFAKLANLGDRNLEHIRDYSHSSKLAWMPRDDRFDDGAIVTAPAGSYQANPWGLFDVHGNAAEWTLSNYQTRAGAATADDATDDPNVRKVVRGGSWHDRPLRARSAARRSHPAWMQIHDVGFRIVAAASP
jgi:formylglycine-generating enzyme required for sulfatase activity